MSRDKNFIPSRKLNRQWSESVDKSGRNIYAEAKKKREELAKKREELRKKRQKEKEEEIKRRSGNNEQVEQGGNNNGAARGGTAPSIPTYSEDEQKNEASRVVADTLKKYDQAIDTTKQKIDTLTQNRDSELAKVDTTVTGAPGGYSVGAFNKKQDIKDRYDKDLKQAQAELDSLEKRRKEYE